MGSQESSTPKPELNRTDEQKHTNSSKLSTKLSSEAQQAIPSGFRFSGGAKEMHGHKIYCVAWSTDVHENSVPNVEEQSVDVPSSSVGSEASFSTNNDDSDHPETGNEKCSLLRCFATCGGNQVCLYEVGIPENRSKSRSGLALRQIFVDADDSEVFYACAFGGRSLGHPFGYSPIETYESGAMNHVVLPRDATFLTDLLRKNRKRPRCEMSDADSQSTGDLYDRKELFEKMEDIKSFNGPQLLCVAGCRGVIKVIDTVRRMLFATLSGHGDEVYDMKFCPTNEWLLLSASKDESLRMWNLKTTTCVAIFAGHEGHRESVLSLGWHPLGQKFVSAGMDATVKLWCIEQGDEVSLAIQRSNTVPTVRKDPQLEALSGPRRNFRTVYDQMPYFSSNKVHKDYIDCVQFVGDLVLSKTISNTILLWMPVLSKLNHHRRSTSSHHRLPNEFVVLREFSLNNCEVWFIRFQTDIDCRMLAIGNNVGEIRLWEIGSSPTKRHFCTLTQQQCSSTVRMVSFSPDGKCLVASCDDATLWKWDAV